MVGIDFVGPILPVAYDDSRYILTITDYFTKWAKAIPTMDKSAATVASVLFKVHVYHVTLHNMCSSLVATLSYPAVYAYMGLPQVIVSDNGRSLMNHLQHFLV